MTMHRFPLAMVASLATFTWLTSPARADQADANAAASRVRSYIDAHTTLNYLQQKFNALVNEPSSGTPPGAPAQAAAEQQPPAARIADMQRKIEQLTSIASAALAIGNQQTDQSAESAGKLDTATKRLDGCLVFGKVQAGFSGATSALVDANRPGQKNTFTIINLSLPILSAIFNCKSAS